jgi:hypothetical protein
MELGERFRLTRETDTSNGQVKSTVHDQAEGLIIRRERPPGQG